MQVANLVIEGENIRKIRDLLYIYKDEHYVGSPHIYSANDIVVLMRESYYFRIGSTLMSVIIMKFIADNNVEIEIVTSGGKDGMSTSFGSEKSENRKIVHEIMDICSGNKWEIIDIQPEELKISFYEEVKGKFKNKVSNIFKKDKI